MIPENSETYLGLDLSTQKVTKLYFQIILMLFFFIRFYIVSILERVHILHTSFIKQGEEEKSIPKKEFCVCVCGCLRETKKRN